MVHFVGAGPGAVDLITVRGQRLLEQADVIIYAGSLVNKELLQAAKQGCAIHNSVSMTLEQVVEVMQTAHQQGKDTVRLHTGDPSIYGAIREQMTCLDQAGIPYQVVAGVSSFCGAAATLCAEYTLPSVSQSVIITRMEGRTPVREAESIRSFAAHGASMAIFLSASMAEKLAAELQAGGYPLQTPVAIVSKATWPDEAVYRCTVATMAEVALQNNVTKTALFLVGEFLGENFERSRLYDPAFTHAYRKGKEQTDD